MRTLLGQSLTAAKDHGYGAIERQAAATLAGLGAD